MSRDAWVYAYPSNVSDIPAPVWEAADWCLLPLNEPRIWTQPWNDMPSGNVGAWFDARLVIPQRVKMAAFLDPIYRIPGSRGYRSFPPWSDDTAWKLVCDNLQHLAQALDKYGGHGIVLGTESESGGGTTRDGLDVVWELYEQPGQQPPRMKTPQYDFAAVRVAQRGQECARAVLSEMPGAVLGMDAIWKQLHAGALSFFDGWFREAPTGLVFEYSTLTGDSPGSRAIRQRIRRRYGVPVLPAVQADAVPPEVAAGWLRRRGGGLVFAVEGWWRGEAGKALAARLSTR